MNRFAPFEAPKTRLILPDVVLIPCYDSENC